MDVFLNNIVSIYKNSAEIRVVRRNKIHFHVEWLNSVCNRTLLYGRNAQTKQRIFAFLVHKDYDVMDLANHFKSIQDLCPDGVDQDIRNSDLFIFMQHRRNFKIKKSISFRIVGNAIMSGGIVVPEIVLVCTCQL